MATPSKTNKPKANALTKPVIISRTLAAVIGAGPYPRSEVSKKLWEYIKGNNLQDPNKKTDILPDEKLKAVLDGKARVGMMEMTKMVNQHLSKE